MILRSRVVLRSGSLVPTDQQKCVRSGKQQHKPVSGSSPTRKRFSNTVRVLYPSRQFAYHASASQIGHLKRAGLVAHEIGDKRTIHAVVLVHGPARIVAGTNYVSRAETDTNPAGVLTLRPIASHLRPAFRQVQTDCLVA